MKLFTRTKFIGPIGLVVATAGASAGAAPPTAEQAPTQCEGMEEREPVHAGEPQEAEQREPFGPVALVAEGLSKICLSDEQRGAIEKLGQQVSSKEQHVMEARRAFRSALTEQLQSGRIDEQALKDEIDVVVKAREEASPVFRKAVEDLHGILDQGQRSALVDAITKRVQEHAEASRGWFDAFAKDLHLSEDQKTRIQELLAKAKPHLEEERTTVGAVFDAFKQDEFSMEKVAPVADVGRRTRARAEGMVHAAKELAAILTPEQRAELVNRVEARTMKGAPGERTGEPSGESGVESRGGTQQAVVVARRYRAGAVTGWGGGYAVRRTTVRTGYAAGYPLVGGYGPGIW